MKTRTAAILAVAGLTVGVILAWQVVSASRPVVINGTAVPAVPRLNPRRIVQGQVLYAQSCAACHGTRLEGAPNWKITLSDGSLPPPPHDRTGHTWHHSDAVLLSIIAHGGDPAYHSNMPAFEGRLSEDDMVSILEFIKKHWGREAREFQWWMTSTQSDTDLARPH